MASDAGCLSFLRRKYSSQGRDVDHKAKGRSLSERNEDDRGAVPSTGEYVIEASKQTIDILREASDFLPFPGAKQVLDVALLLMTTYDDVTALEEQVRSLNNRIGYLMVLMVHGISGKDEKDISVPVRQDIDSLGRDLQIIQQDLAKITAQNKLLLIFFKNANKSKVDDCVERLNDALQSFQMSRTIDTGNLLSQIQSKLGNIQKGVGNIEQKVDEIHAWMVQEKGPSSDTSTLVLEEMPVLPKIFGREEIIDRVAQRLVESRPRVGILGAGGMGKTMVAVSVLDHPQVQTIYQPSYRYWVPCVGATTLLTFLQILCKALHVASDCSSPLKDIIDTLKASPHRRLILLDNLETVMQLPDIVSEGGRLSAERILNQLANIPHVSLLVTARTNSLPSDVISWDIVALGGVGLDAARAIFTNIHPPSAGQSKLDDLLKALGYMPYAITLMAKQASKSGATPKQLLSSWKRSGAKSLTKDLRERMTRSIEFSVKSATVEDDPDARKLLSILARLPSGTTREHLENWWGKDVDNLLNGIAALNDTALIIQRQRRVTTSPILQVLPVVQSYLHEHPPYNAPSTLQSVLEACCLFVLHHKPVPGDKSFKEDLKELDVEKNNILSIFLSTTTERLRSLSMLDKQSWVLDAMLAFAWYQYWSKRSTELLVHLLANVANEGTTEDAPILRRVDEARHCLGRMNYQLGCFQDASTELEKACFTFRKLDTTEDRVRAGEATLSLVDVQMVRGRPGHEIQGLVEAAQQDVGEDVKGNALVFLRRGLYSRRNKDPEKGLEYAARAKTLLSQLDHKPAREISDCLLLISQCHGTLRSNPDWLNACLESLEFSRSIGLASWICADLHLLSGCYIWMGRYDEGIGTLKQALEMYDEVGDPQGIAAVLRMTGYAYAKMGDLVGARVAYESAKKRYLELEEAEKTRNGMAHCEYNLRVLNGDVFGEDQLQTPPL
ncbi:hypothetical protein CC2G_013068 [Coprinopsis cinerea AmutBmut pab1-1]|nr:hypothetical protein CC2G_013068 [Coprinopsis cinerea AmutBmut pab1-1]